MGLHSVKLFSALNAKKREEREREDENGKRQKECGKTERAGLTAAALLC